MTNKPMLSVERELLEDLRNVCGDPDLAAEANSILDKPVNFLTPDCPDCACVQDGQCLCIPSKPAAQHQGEPTPITDDMDRLMEAYRLGEFSDEGGSDTVEALSVASFDAAESHGHDADSYMAGYCAALYEQAKPFIWLALKPKHQGEPVAVVIATGGPHDIEDRVLVEPQADLPPIGTKLYVEQPAPVAVAHTMRSVMEAYAAARKEHLTGTSNFCAAMADRLNGV